MRKEERREIKKKKRGGGRNRGEGGKSQKWREKGVSWVRHVHRGWVQREI